MESALIAEEIKKRGITALYHFTRVENLPSIMRRGILPRKVLDETVPDFFYNDDNRYDNCTDAVCLSLEFPNYRMFYYERSQRPDSKWAVLKLKPSILTDFPCAFCWTNASDDTVTRIELSRRMGADAFRGLFADRPGFPQRAALGIPDSYPTNPQAEILAFATIPIEYIQRVHFQDFATLRECKPMLLPGVSASERPEVFLYRQDYSFWKE